MGTKIILGAVLLMCVAVIGYAYISLPSQTIPPSVAPVTIATTSPQAQTTPTSATPPPTTPSTPSPTTSTYSLAAVATHNNASSCWSAINGNVYDLTRWINQHPGGPGAILSICGKDGSAAFNDQHGGQGRPANELAGFHLAPLAQ